MKKTLKKTVSLFTIICMLFTTISLTPILEVLALGNNTKLVLRSTNREGVATNTLSISGDDIVYKIGDIVVGKVRIKNAGSYVTPSSNNNNIEVNLPEYTGDEYSVEAEIIPTEGYSKGEYYFFGSSNDRFPGEGNVNLNINVNGPFNFELAFEESNNNGEGELPMEIFPVVAYFEGIDDGIEMSPNGSIIIPEDFTTGKVSFKVKTCEANGKVVPNDGMNICTSGTQELVNVRIEGIANSGQINRTVTGSADRSFVNISDGFANYGKATIHITSVEENGPVNTIINLEADTLINIRAGSPIDMSYSVGSSAVDQAIITNDDIKDLSIFFGNNETTLMVSGANVSGITNVVGGKSTIINNDGTATVLLPELSKETTTTLKVTIRKSDNTIVTRTINIKRTAILLEYDDRENKLKAGYVMNKGYLYNNQAHNDEVFNAYLQVILYNNDTVVGYKQVKIDDKDIVDRLNNDESWSIETFSDEAMTLYEGTGANKASVFLTNGPVDYNSNTLPSIEFGIGSGLEIKWGN